MPTYLLAATAQESWPNTFDSTVMALFFGIAFGTPILGYVFMVLDFRRYLRSLRRALVVVTRHVPRVPYWALRDRPNCLTTLGLSPGCSEEEVMEAYREKVKTLHPDRGGDLQSFLRLQETFEEAIRTVRETSAAGNASE
ncbi:MAG: J domain-containing protein [Lacipirellulaceae bacterium]